MRNISLTAVALLGAALLTPTGAATAAAETCQGQAATIVGTPGAEIVGTEGADVIVTNGAARVDARGGDDLVCGTGAAPVFATILGAGADTFIADSSGGRHFVYAGAIVGREDVVASDTTDVEADVIRAASAVVISGTVGRPNADIIDLDFGEVVWSGIQTAPGTVSVGTDGILGVRSATGDAVMYAQGTVTGDDTTLTWTGDFERLVFTTSAERGMFTFRGTSGTEHVKVNAPTTYDRNIALRSGKDSYESDTLGGKATRIKGDGGRNQLLLKLTSHGRVRANLSRSRVTATKAGVEDSIRVRGLRPHREREARRRHRHQPRERDRGHRVPDDHQGQEGPGPAPSPPTTTASAHGSPRGAASPRPRSTATVATTPSSGARAMTASSAARARTA